MNDILDKFPPSTVNNSRSIVKKKLESMKKYPAEYKAQELEGMVDGISVDFGSSEPLSGEEHENLLENDNEPY